MTPQLLNDRYRILRTLGSGGFGETFLAEDTQMPSARKCVIKRLLPINNNIQVYELVKERFAREAAILEELGDANQQIPRLYAYFESGGEFYLVQEFVDGETLTDLWKRQGNLSESFVKEILLNCLQILNYVHSKRIVHRDIKPDNILVRAADHLPVLIDFGAVREAMGTVVNSQGNATSSIIIGTPGFMPSEQAAGRPLYSSDLYSLGLTAIYLLTGKMPQELESDPQTGEVIWRQFALQISPHFAETLTKAVMSHPRDRYPTAQAMLQALQSLAAQVAPTIPISPATPKPIPETVPSAPPITQDKPKNKLMFGGLIASGLIGAAAIIGFAMNQEKHSVVEPIVTEETPAEIHNDPVAIAPSSTSSPNTSVPDNSYAWLAERRVTDADLIGKTAFELDIMRNSIYARHGRRFQSQELQAYFNNQTWYEPRYSPQEFPNSLLSSLEQENAVYILQFQDENNLRWITDKPSASVNVVDSSSSSPQKLSPEQAIEQQFTLINSGDYQTAWNRLSPQFQNNRQVFPEGYTTYSNWWETVDFVDVKEVKTVDNNGKNATVDYQVKYHMKNGKTSSESRRVILTWNSQDQIWNVERGIAR
ncbi:MAG: YARHG domain-containing protein [Oscillatoria sp. PMC 1068.18]|nr:YARHG domain-containing protein [Oscillatoria sp. PMC 1076.18]MEC4987558.1 YARHG domain-containing protein [Oscillatoria sp. PMC 1068.18]